MTLGSITQRAAMWEWSAMWPMWCVIAWPVIVSPVCWVGSPWTASVVVVSVQSLWPWQSQGDLWWFELWCLLCFDWDLDLSLLHSDSLNWTCDDVFCVPYGVVLVSLRGYSLRAVHDNVSEFITFMTDDLRSVLCDVSLALETLVFLIGHHIDCWRWNDYQSKLLCCIEFLYFCDGIH